MLPRYFYCPFCGSKFVQKSDYFHCDDCKRNLFPHSAITASVLIIENGKVLLAKRNQEPQKGKLDTVGGFLKYGEHPRDAALRETLEETGLKVKLLKELPVYMDTYLYQDQDIPSLNFSYTAQILGGEMRAADDVAELTWYKIDEVPEKEIGFNLLKNILKDLKKLI